uniref:Uncharacterized protein n=1 Tax=Oryza meridionalis TaxID=40149 RepID=A0A0E0EQL9_9ORYZ
MSWRPLSFNPDGDAREDGMTRVQHGAQLSHGFSAARSVAGPRGVARRGAAHGHAQCNARVGKAGARAQ